MERSYFFDDGIRFSCKRCGNCCTVDSGTVYVSSDEVSIISNFLGLNESVLIEKYLITYKDSYSIKEKNNFDCIFYKSGCLINDVKPNQCRSYPFWRKSMSSYEKWKKHSKFCPGIGFGRMFSKDEILDILEHSVL